MVIKYIIAFDVLSIIKRHTSGPIISKGYSCNDKIIDTGIYAGK